MPSFSVSPSTQTVAVNTNTAAYTVSWISSPGGPTPQAFTLDDGGSGTGTFTPVSPVAGVNWEDSSFTFVYQNSVRSSGGYTLTVHAGAGPLSGATDHSVTCIVTGPITVADDAVSAERGFRSMSQIPESALAGDSSTVGTLVIVIAEQIIGGEGTGISGGTLLFSEGVLQDETAFRSNQIVTVADNPIRDDAGYISRPTVEVNEAAIGGDGAGQVFDPGNCTLTAHSGVSQTWTITGNIKNWWKQTNTDLEPLRNVPLTAFLFTYRAPTVLRTCDGVRIIDRCIYWDITLLHTTTNTAGDFLFTATGVNLDAVQVALGNWILNPNWQPQNCSGLDGNGIPLRWQFVMDPSEINYKCLAGLIGFEGQDYKDTITGSGSHLTSFRPNVPIYYVIETSLPLIFNGSATGWAGDGTSWDCQMRLQNSDLISVYATADNRSYDVTRYYTNTGQGKVTVTDIFGNTGVCSLYYLQFGVPILRLPDNVDWFYLSQVVPSGITLTYAQVIACAQSNPYGEGPPANCSQFYGITIYPHDPSLPDTQAFDRAKVWNRLFVGGGGPSRLQMQMGNYESPTLRTRSVTSFEDTVVFAWTNSAGALKVAVHRTMSAHINDPTGGWLATQTLAASGATAVLCSFVHNGWCYVEALISGAGTTWVSKDFGNTWTSTGGGFAIGTSDFGQGLSAGGLVVVSGGHGAPYFAQVRDNSGATFISAPVIGAGGEPLEYYAGAAFVQHGWVLMWNDGQVPVTAFIEGYPPTRRTTIVGSPAPIASSTIANPIVITTSIAHGLTSGSRVQIVGHMGNTKANGDWPNVTVLSSTTFSIPVAAEPLDPPGGATGNVYPITATGNTTISRVENVTGKGVGMVRGQGYALIMLLYSESEQTTRCAWSGDRGATWVDMSESSALIPMLTMPPALAALTGGKAAICWQENDVPKFRLTLDGGRSIV